MRGVLPLAALVALTPLSSCTSTSPSKGRYALFQQSRVHYRDTGPRTPDAVLLVHDWGCDSAFWQEQIDAIAPSRRVIAVDLPGHGRSDAPLTFDYSQRLFADAIHSVIQDAGLDSVVLVGSGMGARLSRRIASESDLVRGLVLINEMSSRPDPNLVSRLREAAYQEAAGEMAAQRLRTDQRRERTRLALRMRAVPQHVLLGTLLGLHDQAANADSPSAIPQLIIVGGTADPVLSSGMRLVKVEGLGEFPYLEDPTLVSTEIRSFVEQLDASPN